MPRRHRSSGRRQRAAIAVGDAVDIVLRINLGSADLQLDPLQLLWVNASLPETRQMPDPGQLRLLQGSRLGGTQ